MGSRKLMLGLLHLGLLWFLLTLVQPAPGKGEPGPGASVVGAERATPHHAAPTPDSHGDTQGHTDRGTAAAGATKEPGTQKVPAGEGGRVRARAAAGA